MKRVRGIPKARSLENNQRHDGNLERLTCIHQPLAEHLIDRLFYLYLECEKRASVVKILCLRPPNHSLSAQHSLKRVSYDSKGQLMVECFVILRAASRFVPVGVSGVYSGKVKPSGICPVVGHCRCAHATRTYTSSSTSHHCCCVYISIERATSSSVYIRHHTYRVCLEKMPTHSHRRLAAHAIGARGGNNTPSYFHVFWMGGCFHT